jgi:hypothetical protein
MPNSQYKKSDRLSTYTFGYYVFTLPNGKTFDMFSCELIALPEGDLSNLRATYVERKVTGPELLDALITNRDVALRDVVITSTGELESALASAAELHEDLERCIDRELTEVEEAVAAVAGV